jgi:hypothetical protein
MTERLLSKDDICEIGYWNTPKMVFSDNLYSVVSARIKGHTKGAYNHFMWMVRPGWVVSQDWILREVSIQKYLEGAHRLKFVDGIHWTAEDRERLRRAIMVRVAQPWHKRLYDWPQIVGIRFGMPWLQVPGIGICSGLGAILRLVDAECDLKPHSSPEDVNAYTKARPDRYRVFGRYIPD